MYQGRITEPVDLVIDGVGPAFAERAATCADTDDA